MATVQKAGEKFSFQNRVLTAKSFFGETGHEFGTAAEAQKANPKGSMICVKNLENGGATQLDLSIAEEEAARYAHEMLHAHEANAQSK